MKTREEILTVVKLQEAITGDVRTSIQAKEQLNLFMAEVSQLTPEEFNLFKDIRIKRIMKTIPFIESERLVLSDEDHKQYM